MLQSLFAPMALALAATLAAPLNESANPSREPGKFVPSASASSANGSPVVGTAVTARNPRVVFITSSDSKRSQEELTRLERPGGDFAKLRAAGWKIGPGAENHLQIVDREQIAALVEQLQVKNFPAVVCIDKEQIVRSFTSGCTTPLDIWTFGFLAKGVDERPPGTVSEAARVETTGHYPLRGNHWSVDDDWNPTKTKVVSHLRGPNHGHQIRAEWAIESWSYEEVRSLHDNLHEQEMGGVSFAGSRSSSSSASQFSAGRKAGGR